MKSHRRAAFVVVTALAVLPMLAGLGLVGGLRINVSPSNLIGLWRIEPMHRRPMLGDRIFICPPPIPVFIRAHERGYLSSGLCPGGFSPLIKTVVALPGQHIRISNEVIIDGVRLERSVLRAQDGQNRDMMPARDGIVPNGQLFLHSSFAGSFDSRYFGPIPATGLLGHAKPLIVFAP